MRIPENNNIKKLNFSSKTPAKQDSEDKFIEFQNEFLQRCVERMPDFGKFDLTISTLSIKGVTYNVICQTAKDDTNVREIYIQRYDHWKKINIFRGSAEEVINFLVSSDFISSLLNAIEKVNIETQNAPLGCASYGIILHKKPKTDESSTENLSTVEKINLLHSKQVKDDDLRYYINLSEKDFQKALELLELTKDVFQVSQFIKMSDEDYERFFPLLKSGFGFFDISRLMYLKKEEAEIVIRMKKEGHEMSACIEYAQASEANRRKIDNLELRGLNFKDAVEITTCVSAEESERIIFLLENGYLAREAQNLAKDQDKFEKVKDRIISDVNPTRDFLESGNYFDKIKANSKGKYQDVILKMFNPDTMSFKLKSSLLESKLPENVILSSLQKLSKSTFKLAYETPNQYLSNIDIKFTQKIDGKYPELTGEDKQNQQQRIIEFFSRNMGIMLRALNYIDCDTLNQMMDKRTEIFQDMLSEIDDLTDENYVLLSELIKCKSAKSEKNLTAKEKINLCRMVRVFQKQKIDKTTLEDMTNEKSVDFNRINSILYEKILENAEIDDGMKPAIINRGIKFDPEYLYTLLSSKREMNKQDALELIQYLRNSSYTERLYEIKDIQKIEYIPEDNKAQLIEIYKKPQDYSDSEIIKAFVNVLEVLNKDNEINVVIKHAILEDFDEFISDTSNIYGQVNQKTKDAFTENGLDFAEWENPSVEDINFEVKGRSMKIKTWDRNPVKDIFIGNKTSCCTAIGAVNGDATSSYLLNKAFNVVTLCDENDNTLGMARIFTANIDGKPSVVIDSIEINQGFLKNLNVEEMVQVRNNLFKYVKNISKNLSTKDIPTYFSSKFAKISKEGLKEEHNQNIEFIGELSKPLIYINCYGDWVKYHELKTKNIGVYDV